MNLELKTTLLITAIILLLKGVKFQSITVIVLSLKETKRRKNNYQKTLSGRLRRSRSEVEVFRNIAELCRRKAETLIRCRVIDQMKYSKPNYETQERKREAQTQPTQH